MTPMPQHLQAINKANETRRGIADFRRAVRAAGSAEGARMVARAIEFDHDTVLGGARVGVLMRAIRSIGTDKVYRGLIAAGVPSGDKKLRDMTERQREAVAIQLMLWAESRS